MQEFDKFIEYIKAVEAIYTINSNDELFQKAQNLELKAKNIAFNHSFDKKGEFAEEFGDYIDEHVEVLMDYHSSIPKTFIEFDDFLTQKKSIEILLL